MKRLIIHLGVAIFLLMCFRVYADVIIDGYEREEVEIITFDAVTAPSVSPTGEARMYYDISTDTVRLSQNAGAYADLVGGAGSGAFTATGDGAYLNGDMSISGNASIRGDLTVSENIMAVTYGSDGSVTDAEFLFLDATSSIQTQLNAKGTTTLTDEASLYSTLSDVTEFLETADAASLTSLDTGEGANELFDMDQNVLVASNVTFANLTATGNLEAATYGSDDSVTDAELLVIGTTLQGELGGTLGNPTVDSGIHDDEYIEIAETEAVVFNSSLSIANNLTVNVDLHIDNDLTATGNFYLGGDILGSATGDDITIDSDDDIILQDETFINDELSVGGNSIFNKDLTVEGANFTELHYLSKSGAYTVTPQEALRHVTVYMDGAATIMLPAIADNMAVTVITIGAVAVDVDVNASDLMILDGTKLTDGDEATNTSTAGDMIVCTYFSDDGWVCQSDGWTDD